MCGLHLLHNFQYPNKDIWLALQLDESHSPDFTKMFWMSSENTKKMRFYGNFPGESQHYVNETEGMALLTKTCIAIKLETKNVYKKPLNYKVKACGGENPNDLGAMPLCMTRKPTLSNFGEKPTNFAHYS